MEHEDTLRTQIYISILQPVHIEMLNTTSFSVVAATLNVAAIPTSTPMTTTTMTTPTVATVISTMSSSSTIPIRSTISIPTAPSSLQALPSKPVQNTQGNCRPQAPGYGPTPEQDNMQSFYSSPPIQAPAQQATTPHGYTLAFRRANASYVGTNYLGYHELQAYSPTECASRCLSWGTPAAHGTPETSSTALFPHGFDSSRTPTSTLAPRTHVCNSFNIYFERSPSIHLGADCKDADSRTIIKCALWGEVDMRDEGATNTGYRSWDFDVVITASNGYVLGIEQEGKEENMKTSEGEKSVRLNVAAVLVERFVVGVALTFLMAVHMGF